jgi:ribonuclease HII
MKCLCGIDEAGRGPLAGDLVIAGCVLDGEIKGLNDSKKISATKRELLYKEIIQHATAYHIVSFSPQEIDEKGISVCLQVGLREIMQSIDAQTYLFDGNTSFGIPNLKHMVQADKKVAQVSAASILAKVTHDRDIVAQAHNYPQYHFEKHKGYGTKLHIEMIQKYGYCPLHRKSYKIKALEARLF